MLWVVQKKEGIQAPFGGRVLEKSEEFSRVFWKWFWKTITSADCYRLIHLQICRAACRGKPQALEIIPVFSEGFIYCVIIV